MYGDGKTTARVEFKRASAVDDVDLDDKVTLLVKGKVKALRGPERRKDEYGGPKGKGRTMEIPGSMELEDCEFKVVEHDEWDKATEAMEADE